MATSTVEPFYRHVGRRISEIRSKRGLTQEQLAARLDPSVTRAAIANIEGGKQRVLSHTLWQLAAALGVSPDELAPAPTNRSTASESRQAVEDELGKTLKLPEAEIKKLAARIPSADQRKELGQ